MKRNFICKICGRVFCGYTAIQAHVAVKHRLSSFEYSTQYLSHPKEPPICKCGCGEIVGPWRSMKYSWPKFVNGHAVRTEIVKKKLSEKCGRIPWNKGLTKDTNETILKISESNKLNNHASDPEIRNKISNSVKELHKKGREENTGPYSTKWKQKLSKASKQLGAEGKLWAQTPKGKEKLSVLNSERNLSGKMAVTKFPTKPELIVEEWFKESIHYVGNGKFWIRGSNRNKNPDFKVNGQRKVIEIDGDYWHTKEQQEELKEFYSNLNWGVLFIWVSEIYKNPDKIKNEIHEFILC